jgi:hypothetical protein
MPIHSINYPEPTTVVLEPIDPSPVFPNNIEIAHINGMESCSICHHDMEEAEDKYVIPECDHKFHSHCIIEWFRTPNQSSCPLCRSQPNNPEGYRLDFNTRNARYKFNRTFSRRKNAPKQLKSLVEKLRKQENKFKTAKRERLEWLMSEEGLDWKRLNKTYKKNFGKLWRKRWSWRNLSTRIHVQIAEYPIIQTTVIGRR